ncbi:MAG: ribose 5-phosphate isomerase B [Acidimicrobiia bacterium]|nr:ribose 5-phosphate isomerase B [Acidimicrobiia bacterium]
MRIAVGSDHAGFVLKNTIAEHLGAAGHQVIDVGTDQPVSVDYPDFGASVGRAVVGGDAELGVAVCGSGIGICIAANKVRGVRAATVHDVTSARLSREHNNANIMCVGERFIGPQVALDAVDAFLVAEFAQGRHTRRVDKITQLELQQQVEQE